MLNTNIYDYLEICQKEINQLGQNLNYSTPHLEIINTMEEIYKHIKNVCTRFYNKETREMDSSYKFLYRLVYNMIDKINPYDYIIPTNYNYDRNFIIPANINYKSEDETLDILVHNTYKKYQEENFIRRFEEYSFANKCEEISTLFSQECSKFNIQCQIIKMEAGFSKSANLYNGHRFHYFNIVTIGNRQYIVDLAYRQFFTVKRNIFEGLGVPMIFTPSPGCYMLLNEERENVAKELLKKGYIILTPDTLKHYLDGFTLSFRNGLYYEQNGISYTTPYTYEQYLDFLYADASLTDYEDRSLLGYQKRPLHNPNFEFNKVAKQ